MAERRLARTGAKITPAMLETALQLRSDIHAYLGCPPNGTKASK
jgi:hypothetical protein